MPCAWMVPNCDLKVPPHPLLAVDTVRYVGDGVALVVAESREAARDALDLIEVDYDPLAAVVDPEQATLPGAPQLHADVASNVAFTWTVAGGDADAAFAAAPVAVDLRIVQQRLLPSAMETRAAVASYNAGSGQLTLHVTSQNPHICRFLCSVMLKLPEHRIRVVAPEVGGAFGSKIPTYADEALACFASMELGRPVKWTEDRSENYKVTMHGRDHVAVRRDVRHPGRHDHRPARTRLRRTRRVRVDRGAGHPDDPPRPDVLGRRTRSPTSTAAINGVYTTATPVDAYRGAGRPEATYMIERLVDIFARKIGMDPVEVRRKNLIPKDEFPYTVVTGLTYDSGNYERRARQRARVVRLRRLPRRAGRRRAKQNRYLGIGVTTYNEICGLGPSAVAGAVGFGGGLYESAIVRVYPTGTVRVYIGAKPHGQGEETTFAQIVAEEFGIAVDDVQIVHGDTDDTPQGWGTYGSRTTAVCGSAVKIAAAAREGQSAQARRAPARGERSGLEWKRRQVRRARLAGAGQGLRRARADGERRVEHARRGGAGPRGDGVLRSDELRLPVRHPHLHRRGGRRDRRGEDPPLHRRGRLRPAHQPDDRRGADPRRRRRRGSARRCRRWRSTTRTASSSPGR